MRVYIAGPMSGLPDCNYPAFFAAADQLAELGHEPINPARLDGRQGCSTWLEFMRASLRDIAGADGIALLPGWEDSRGAWIEHRLGRDLDLITAPLDTWLSEATA